MLSCVMSGVQFVEYEVIYLSSCGGIEGFVQFSTLAAWSFVQIVTGLLHADMYLGVQQQSQPYGFRTVNFEVKEYRWYAFPKLFQIV